MAEIYFNEKRGVWAYRQGLRSPYIDYFHGWFFITFQISKNKSVLGAIVEQSCILNELGEAIRSAWETEPEHAPGLKLFDFQVMPNHFHALVYYDGRGAGGRGGPPATGGDRATPPDRCGLKPRCQVAAKYERNSHGHDLPYVVGMFKSWTTKLYHRLKAEGRCVDIGPQLWQESFYDELVRSEDQFKKTAIYIRANPANWNLDRFGAVTAYAEGNLDLLQSEYVAYLSSEGYAQGALPGTVPMQRIGGDQDLGARKPLEPGRPVISTFTSFYERQVLEKCLKSGRRFIWICPGGIGPETRVKALAALESGQALLLSPVAPCTGVNKQRANWCNQFIVKNASEIWAGHIRSGGSLETILRGCGKGAA